MTEQANADVVVLAGDRGPEDPLALDAGVPGKVLVPLAGRALLTHVMQALSRWPERGQVAVVSNNAEPYQDAVKVGVEYQFVEPASGPAASLAMALRGLSGDRPVLVLTGDHPLLKPEWWQPLLQAMNMPETSDALVGLVDYAQVMQRFPQNRRTRYRFADISVCGSNIFLLATPKGRKLADLWQSFERDRKKPWRIVARLGWANLLRYLLGRLTLEQAFDLLSKRFGVRVQPVLLPWPEAAVDVDSAVDLALVRQIFAERAEP
ncbi:MAG: nucleotidyltransferase family protein [Pseudomonadota bacterium]